MDKFSFPATLTPDEEGGFVITFRDIPEAITQGETLEDSLTEASDCLEEAIAAYIEDGRDIPLPSKPRIREKLVSIPLQMAMKAAIYLVMRETNLSKSEFARKMNLDEKEARRILDPHHNTKLPTMEQALNVLGKRTELRIF